MIAIRGFADSGNMTQALFVTPECPVWAKCAAMNADGSIAFFDTIPLGCDETRGQWIFREWLFVRCRYSSRRGRGDWRRSLLIREA